MIENKNEPLHDKTNNVAVRPVKTQISLGIPPSLIRVFDVRMIPWVLSYPLSAQQRLIKLGGCPGWSESLLGAHSFFWFCHVTAHILLMGGHSLDMSYVMRHLFLPYANNKAQISLSIRAVRSVPMLFAALIVKYLLFLYPKFQDSSYFL